MNRFAGVAATGEAEDRPLAYVFGVVLCAAFLGALAEADFDLGHGPRALALFWQLTFTVFGVVLVGVPAHCVGFGFPHYWPWLVAVVTGTLGYWVLLYAIGVGYVVVAQTRPALANVAQNFWES